MGNYWITDTSQWSQDKVSKGCTSTWQPTKLRECHGHGTSESMPWRRCQKWHGRRALEIDELKRACKLNCAGPEPSSCQSTWSKAHEGQRRQRRHGLDLSLSLSLCLQKLSLESVNAFGALWSARIQSPQLPRKRGARVCSSHLFEHGKNQTFKLPI